MALVAALLAILAIAAAEVELDKCCPQGETLGTSDHRPCVPSPHRLLHPFRPPPVYKEPGILSKNASYTLRLGYLPRCRLLYYLEPDREPAEEFWLLESGTVVRAGEGPLYRGNYCLEAIPQKDAVLPVLCFPEGQVEGVGVYAVYPVGMLVSIPFLATTILVYTTIRQLKNLHGRNVVCHVACLLLGYLCLATIQIDTTAFPHYMCVVMGSPWRRSSPIRFLSAELEEVHSADWWEGVVTWSPPKARAVMPRLSQAALVAVACLVAAARSQVVILPKCCPIGETIISKQCRPTNLSTPIAPIHDSSFQPLLSAQVVLHHRPLQCTRLKHKSDYWIFPNGSILRKGYQITDRYCLENLRGTTYPIFCLPEKVAAENFGILITTIGYLISIPLAAVSLLLHAVLKELNTLHGKIVMCVLAAFIVSCIFQCCNGFKIITMDDPPCKLSGYAIQFFFMATFFWLNVMCFDIYWAFSGLKNLTGSVKERERKKLVLYSLYAWGFPLLILIITLGVDYSPQIPLGSIWKPNVGVDKCFFKDNFATGIYFYMPMGLIILINIILFSITAFRICTLQRETAVLKREGSKKHDNTNDKERFSLYLKLFLVMGINWVMELVSFLAGGPSYIWYIPDFTNTLQGVFIFIIFVWKKRVRRLIVAKIRACFGMTAISSNGTTKWPWTSSKHTSNTTSSNLTQNGIKMQTISNQVPAPSVPGPDVPATAYPGPDTTKPTVISA